MGGENYPVGCTPFSVCWDVGMLGCNSHHQDYEPYLGSGIPKKTFICHWNPGWGGRSNVY